MVLGRRGRSRSDRAAQMRELIAEFETSGESQVGFCRGHGLALSTFLYWRRRIRGASQAGARSAFVELQVVSGKAGAGVEIALPGGAVAKIGLDASEELIRRVLRAAGAPC